MANRPPPRQPRAEAKRARILAAAEALLKDLPPAALSTRKVAEAAEVPIGSVYRYFSNADDLLVALFDSFNAETLEALEALKTPPPSWRAELRRILSIIEVMHERHSAYGAVMAHLGRRASENEAVTGALTEGIARAAPGLETWTAREVAATVIAITEAVERRADGAAPEARARVFDEGGKALEAYLALYLD